MRHQGCSPLVVGQERSDGPGRPRVAGLGGHLPVGHDIAGPEPVEHGRDRRSNAVGWLGVHRPDTIRRPTLGPAGSEPGKGDGMRQDIEFDAEGVTLRGWLYLPGRRRRVDWPRRS